MQCSVRQDPKITAYWKSLSPEQQQSTLATYTRLATPNGQASNYWSLVATMLDAIYAPAEDVEQTLLVVSSGMNLKEICNIRDDLREYLSDTCNDWGHYLNGSSALADATSPSCSEPTQPVGLSESLLEVGPGVATCSETQVNVQQTGRNKQISAQ